LPRNGNVLLDATSQGRDYGSVNFGCDLANSLGVAGRGNRKSRLDDVNAQGLELAGE
jgi:hypothetical protein